VTNLLLIIFALITKIMICFPNAKINLGLNIISKRTDGFHNIETIFYPVPLCDVLEIVPSPDHKFHFSASGIPIDGRQDNNLCIKVYNLFKKQFQLPPVHIFLHKVIPFGAGLGGGSSDAASTLLMLNTMFSLKIEQPQLIKFAAKLGSDCAFFIRNEPLFAYKRGDVFKKTDMLLSEYSVIIVKPTFSVNTAYAYSLVKDIRKKTSLLEIINKPVGTWKDRLTNDFESVIFHLNPKLEFIKQKLYEAGAEYSAMSGSGSAVFGIFRSIPDKPESLFPDCFIWSGNL
jgi:4-diphosphocytidyl-2-C-methyl-D-erythritol kinase